MPKYIIVTKIPARQVGLFNHPAKYTVDETERESVSEVQQRLHIPLGGYCMIIDRDNINCVVSEKQIVNKVPNEL